MIMGLFRLLESALTSLYPFISQVTELCWKDNLTGYWRSSGVTYRSPECYLPEALCLLGCSASPAPQSCSACLSSRVTLRVCSLLFVHIPPLLLFIYLFIVAPPPKVSVHSPGCFGTHCVDHIGLSPPSAEIEGVHQHSHHLLSLLMTTPASARCTCLWMENPFILPFRSTHLQGNKQNADKGRPFFLCRINIFWESLCTDY